MLNKWKTSEPVSEHIPSHLLDKKTLQEITCTYAFTIVLGIEWDTNSDTFCPLISSPSSEGTLTKRTLLSLIARLYDILGWYSPALIKPKILLWRLWENGLDWDDPVSQPMRETWERWCGKLPVLRGHLIPHSYFLKEVNGTSTQLHGFCDASKPAYAGLLTRMALYT